jgi:hypothetical protein
VFSFLFSIFIFSLERGGIRIAILVGLVIVRVAISDLRFALAGQASGLMVSTLSAIRLSEVVAPFLGSNPDFSSLLTC